LAVTARLADFVEHIGEAGKIILDALSVGGKVIAFGNCGSAADAQHFAAELVGRCRVNRRPLRRSP
jgi:phosphoheptose isomerase